MLGVDLDGSRRIQKDRLDDHRDDQGASDRESDGMPLAGGPVLWL
jgi:hypothetical protein